MLIILTCKRMLMDVESLPETAQHFYLMVTHRLSPSIKGIGDSQEKNPSQKLQRFSLPYLVFVNCCFMQRQCHILQIEMRPFLIQNNNVSFSSEPACRIEEIELFYLSQHSITHHSYHHS